jgi:hypothetical protein
MAFAHSENIMYGCTLWQPSGIGFTRAIATLLSQTILLRAEAPCLVKTGSGLSSAAAGLIEL